MENQSVEYKSNIPSKPNHLKAEIVSFLNSNDGVIYLGVSDDGESIFEMRSKFKEWESKISEWINNAFNKTMQELIKLEVTLDTFSIHIKKGKKPPYYFKNGEGFNTKGVFIRIGSSKRQATDEEIRRMLTYQVAHEFESQSAQIEQTLTFQQLQDKLLDNDIIFDKRSLRLLDANGDYNNGALILSEQNTFVTKIAVVDGLDMTADFLAKKEFSGSLIKQIDMTLEYISLLNDKKVSFTGAAARLEYEAYPSKAIREAVINAYAHRDYSLSADTKIEIYDDRIEMFSAGGIPDGLTVEEIKTGTSARRNRNIVYVLDKITYMENYGSGIRRILGSYQDTEKEPIFIVTPNQFKVILYNRHYTVNKNIAESWDNNSLKKNLSDAEQLELGFTVLQDNSLFDDIVTKDLKQHIDASDEKIIKLLRLNEEMSRKEIESYFEESRTKIYQRLTKLIELNLISKRGQNRSTVYSTFVEERK